jgi:hypothetical protein
MVAASSLRHHPENAKKKAAEADLISSSKNARLITFSFDYNASLFALQ